jgi:chromate reductase
MPKILIIPGSLSTRSQNVRLAALLAKELTLADADVTRISLSDYPLPIYDAEIAEESGPIVNALRLKQLMCAHHGVFIASPEYYASISPVLKNTLDWIASVREAGEPALAAFQNRVFALGGTSFGPYGVVQALSALRHVLAVGCRALVIPEQLSIGNAGQAFDEMDGLRDERASIELKALVRKLVDTAALFAGR